MILCMPGAYADQPATLQAPTEAPKETLKRATQAAENEMVKLINNEVLQAIVTLNERVDNLNTKLASEGNALETLRREQAAQQKIMETFAMHTSDSQNKIAPSEQQAQQTDVSDYDAAIFLIKAGHLNEANKALGTFIQTHPSSTKNADARYWQGFIALKNKSLKEAEATFSDIVQHFPLSDKHADAMLKIGMIYTETGRFSQALSTYESLQKEHPKSDAAKQAQLKLNEMTGLGAR
jgi:tol-pal system protein YbgF